MTPSPSLQRIEAILHEFAIEVFPAWTTATSTDQLLQSCPWRSSLRSLARELEELLIQDPILSKLYPSLDPTTGGLGGYYLAPSGAAGPIYPNSFVQDLLMLAWDEYRLSHLDPMPGDFVSEVSKSLAEIVTGIQGKFGPIPVRTGVAGIRLPDEVTQLDLPHGHFRNPDERDLWRASRPHSQVLSQGVHLIYESSYSSGGKVVKLEDEKSAVASAGRAEWIEHDRHWRLARFALALVRPVRVLRLWDWARTPLGHQQVGSGRVVVDAASLTLTPEEAAAWKSLAFDLEKLPLDYIDVAIDRSLRMLDETSFADDLLINSVMAWENLFGATGDTSFRVAACLSIVLEPDPELRPSTFRDVKKLYDLRSQVVHGSSHLKGADFGRAFEAKTLTFTLLKTIIASRPELLSLKDGNERSKDLILRGK
jgi:hypothetical protein